MIIVCPSCGTKNRIPDPFEPSKTYCCAKCRIRLTDIPKAADTKGEGSVIAQVDSIDRTEYVQVRKESSLKSFVAASLHSFRVSEKQLIFGLALLALLPHLFLIPYGDMPVFDEHHYVPEARSIVREGELTTPHPTLGKLFIASGIRVFGDNPWGWRSPSVIFAVASTVLFYLICRKLMGKMAALFASLLLIFESLTFVLSGLAMLDVFSLTFMLLAFLFYLQDRYVFSGVSLALSGLCKMTGLLGGLVIVAHWFLQKRKESPRSIAFFVASAFAAFMLLMPLVDFAATGEWLSPIDRLRYMLIEHSSKTFESLTPEQLAYASYPWEWLFSPRADRFIPAPAYEFALSYTVFIVILPSMGYMVYELAKNRTDVSFFTLLWFAATYLVWIPVVLATDRQAYLYYFYPTVGAICIAVGFALAKLWKAPIGDPLLTRMLIVGYLALHLIILLSVSPLQWGPDFYARLPTT